MIAALLLNVSVEVENDSRRTAFDRNLPEEPWKQDEQDIQDITQIFMQARKP